MMTMSEAGAISLIRTQMPHLAPADVEGYVRFAERMGADSSPHLKWVCDSVAEFVPHGRVMQGAVLKAIAELPANLVNVKRCLCLSCLQCPSSKVTSGVVGWVSGLAVAPAKLL